VRGDVKDDQNVVVGIFVNASVVRFGAKISAVIKRLNTMIDARSMI